MQHPPFLRWLYVLCQTLIGPSLPISRSSLLKALYSEYLPRDCCNHLLNTLMPFRWLVVQLHGPGLTVLVLNLNFLIEFSIFRTCVVCSKRVKKTKSNRTRKDALGEDLCEASTTLRLSDTPEWRKTIQNDSQTSTSFPIPPPDGRLALWLIQNNISSIGSFLQDVRWSTVAREVASYCTQASSCILDPKRAYRVFFKTWGVQQSGCEIRQGLSHSNSKKALLAHGKLELPRSSTKLWSNATKR